ncbi:hypothetical protein G7Y89_g9115 [Cudoniella acicularis]|uniref:A to I editase domain-containing protein n=1 Tax=Cudoniella acicularis TaxID=354080 RepID=A0A8H4RG79_9HELO|nr:hypothetical protein G7Y89_g9115 [Cudoniella acicularis]
MEASADAIADVVLKEFDSWEKKRKPLVRTNGVREWIPLSGIVAQGKNSLTCLAVATGMKCLPQKSISKAQGVVLHDWHAEILAIRSFNRFLLEECYALAVSKKKSSEYVRVREEHERTASHFQPFALNDGIHLHMYSSEAPCGDASMELTIAAQEDATPWNVPETSTSTSTSSTPSNESDLTHSTSLSSTPDTLTQPILPGRSYFSQLGIVRRKPSRPDAPPTLSKSCTDKLTLKQSTSLLSSLTNLLISPQNVYIHTLVLPSSQLFPIATTRAFSPSGRVLPLSSSMSQNWQGGYAFKPFEVLGTNKEFSYSRRQIGDVVSSNISSYSYPKNISETIIGGTLQGRKQFDVRGASRICKRRMWKLALEISVLAGVPAIKQVLMLGTYKEVKESSLLEGRGEVKRDVRAVLGGWLCNEGGNEPLNDGVEKVTLNPGSALQDQRERDLDPGLDHSHVDSVTPIKLMKGMLRKRSYTSST